MSSARRLQQFGRLGSDFMDDLESTGFASAYHLDRNYERGAELDPTLWWRRNTESRYHIDYTFVRPADAIQNVNVGADQDWITYSDHPPMTVDLMSVGPNPGTPPIRRGSSVSAALSHPPASGNGSRCVPGRLVSTRRRTPQARQKRPAGPAGPCQVGRVQESPPRRCRW